MRMFGFVSLCFSFSKLCDKLTSSLVLNQPLLFLFLVSETLLKSFLICALLQVDFDI